MIIQIIETFTVLILILTCALKLQKLMGRENFLEMIIYISETKTLYYIKKSIAMLTIAASILGSFLIGATSAVRGDLMLGFLLFSSLSFVGVRLGYLVHKYS